MLELAEIGNLSLGKGKRSKKKKQRESAFSFSGLKEQYQEQ